jgi:hypothetical protein
VTVCEIGRSNDNYFTDSPVESSDIFEINCDGFIALLSSCRQLCPSDSSGFALNINGPIVDRETFVTDSWELGVDRVSVHRNCDFASDGCVLCTNDDFTFLDDDIVSFEVDVHVVGEDDCSFLDDDSVQNTNVGDIDDENLSVGYVDEITSDRCEITTPSCIRTP